MEFFFQDKNSPELLTYGENKLKIPNMQKKVNNIIKRAVGDHENESVEQLNENDNDHVLAESELHWAHWSRQAKVQFPPRQAGARN